MINFSLWWWWWWRRRVWCTLPTYITAPIPPSLYLHHCTYPALTLPTSLYLSHSYCIYITIPIPLLLYLHNYTYHTLTVSLYLSHPHSTYITVPIPSSHYLPTSLYLSHPHTTYLHHCTYPILTLRRYISHLLEKSYLIFTHFVDCITYKQQSSFFHYLGTCTLFFFS